MEVKKLLSDGNIDVTALYLHGELFSVQVYIKDEDGYVDSDVTVYKKSGRISVQ